MKSSAAVRRVLGCLCLLSVFGLTSSCSEIDDRRRVFLIGVDGATWDVMDALLKAGRMPHLQSMIKEGTRSDLASMLPCKSPALWTTVVTGKSFEKHGIDDFTKAFDESTATDQAAKNTPKAMHMTSNMRKTKALWNIVGERGRGSAFIGWWVSWPAEEVNGIIVSSRVPLDQTGGKAAPTKGSLFRDGTGQTWPPELFEEIEPMIRPAGEVSYEEARRFMDICPEEMERNIVKGFQWAFGADETYRAVAKHIFKKEPDLDLYGIYFNGVDVVEHRYWKYIDPRGYRPYPPEERPRFRFVIERYYEYTDELLGEILEQRRPNDTFVLVSDHGFKTGGHDDGPPGIFVACGSGIEPGARLNGPRLLDITPTILALLDHPVADDMDGRVLDELFTDEWQQASSAETVESYDTPEWLAARDDSPQFSPTDSGFLEHLKGLGYIGGKDD